MARPTSGRSVTKRAFKCVNRLCEIMPPSSMTAYPSTSPRNEDVVGVLNILSAYTVELETDEPVTQASQHRYRVTNLLSVSFVGVAALVLLWNWIQPLPHAELYYAGLLVLAILVSLWANIRVYQEQPEVLRSLRQPRQALMASILNRLELEERYVTQLLQHELDTLRFASARLTQAGEIQKERAEATFGAATRLGLFPTVLTAAAAVLPVVKGAPLWVQVVSGVLVFLLIANQSTATTMHMAVLDTRLMLGLLNRALPIREAQQQVEAIASSVTA